jgi:predicted  nucleic acid-binding Zn-ribbon protein
MSRRREQALMDDFRQEKASALIRLQKMDSKLKHAVEELAFRRIELKEIMTEKNRFKTTLEKERKLFEKETAKLTKNVGVNQNFDALVNENIELIAAQAQHKLDLDRLNRVKDGLGQNITLVTDQKNKYQVKIDEQEKLLTTEVAKRRKLEADVEIRERDVEQLQKKFENDMQKEKEQVVISWREKYDVLQESRKIERRLLQTTLNDLAEVSIHWHFRPSLSFN